jgi:hypothetical protein
VPLRRLALIAALALVAVPAAHADADPASDVLYVQRIYLPFFGEKVSPAHAAALKKTVDAAWNKGYKIKVALIATRNDLGGVFQLWEKPQTYADFLGRELVFLYKGKLITVMPNGLGVYQYKQPVTKEKALVKTVDVGEGADGIADAASIAVAKLAGLPPPKLPKNTSGSGDGGTPVWQLVVIVGGGVAILAAMLILGPMAWRRRQTA